MMNIIKKFSCFFCRKQKKKGSKSVVERPRPAYQENLDKLLLRNLEENKAILKRARDKIDEFLSEKEVIDYEESLFGGSVDKEQWVVAQYEAARRQIEKIISPDSFFNKSYQNVHQEKDLILLTRVLIHDLYRLKKISNFDMGLDGFIDKNNHVSPISFFVKAKFSYSDRAQKFSFSSNGDEFQFSLMPALLRQSIELKVKDMIGFVSARRSGKWCMVGINQILLFFEKNEKIIDLPVKASTLRSINGWANSFVHEGISSFSWQSLEAVDLLEDLFSIKDEKTGAIYVNGFVRFFNGASLEDIVDKFKEENKIDLILDERAIRATVIRAV